MQTSSVYRINMTLSTVINPSLSPSDTVTEREVYANLLIITDPVHNNCDSIVTDIIIIALPHQRRKLHVPISGTDAHKEK